MDPDISDVQCCAGAFPCQYRGGYPEYLHPAFDTLSLGIARISGLAMAFNMQMFFALSGAVLHLRPLGPFDDFVKKKAKRLLVPFWAVGLLFMAPIWWAENGCSVSNIGQMLRAFQRGEVVSHLWFVLALFWCMLIFAAMLKILERLNCHSLLIPFFLSCLCSWLAARYGVTDFLQMKRTFFYLPWFALGYWLDAERGKVESLSAGRTVFVIALTVAAGLLEWEDYCRALLGITLCTLISHLCTLWFAKLEERPAYKLLARNLFPIYLLHVPLNNINYDIIVKNRLLAYRWGCVLYLVSRTVGVVLLSILIGECCRSIKKRFLIKWPESA